MDSELKTEEQPTRSYTDVEERARSLREGMPKIPAPLTGKAPDPDRSYIEFKNQAIASGKLAEPMKIAASEPEPDPRSIANQLVNEMNRKLDQKLAAPNMKRKILSELSEAGLADIREKASQYYKEGIREAVVELRQSNPDVALLVANPNAHISRERVLDVHDQIKISAIKHANMSLRNNTEFSDPDELKRMPPESRQKLMALAEIFKPEVNEKPNEPVSQPPTTIKQ